jgi:hypothetical protein
MSFLSPKGKHVRLAICAYAPLCLARPMTLGHQYVMQKMSATQDKGVSILRLQSLTMLAHLIRLAFAQMEVVPRRWFYNVMQNLDVAQD